MRALRAVAAAGAVVAFAGCPNAGEDRILSISATGEVRGLAYFDRNGNRLPDAADDTVGGIRIRLLTKGTRDTVARATAANGSYAMAEVPVGSYVVWVDTAVLADTAVLVGSAASDITVRPGETVLFDVGISYPLVSIAQARTAIVPGRRVFLTGIALNAIGNFRDTTVHLQDTSAALRLTRIRASAIFAGDSVRVRGTISRRAGQPTLDLVDVFPLAVTFLPTAASVTTAVAATADGGRLDAQQVVVSNATVNDTAAVLGDWRLTVDDGSGPLEVLLDAVAFPQVTPGNRAPYVPGNRFDIAGVLVPTGTGSWRLKPRSVAELVQR